jgi:hypothetical protein
MLDGLTRPQIDNLKRRANVSSASLETTKLSHYVVPSIQEAVLGRTLPERGASALCCSCIPLGRGRESGLGLTLPLFLSLLTPERDAETIYRTVISSKGSPQMAKSLTQRMALVHSFSTLLFLLPFQEQNAADSNPPVIFSLRHSVSNEVVHRHCSAPHKRDGRSSCDLVSLNL